MKPYISSYLKDMNRKVIYRLMEEKGVLSRTDIVRITGISGPTVMKIASYMVERGLLLEYGEAKTALGRKPKLLSFNPDAAYTIGVEYREGHVLIAVIDLSGTIALAVKEKLGGGNVLEHLDRKLAPSIRKIIVQSGKDESKMLGIGITVPGAVDTGRHVIVFAPLIGIYEEKDVSTLVQRLSGETGLPVFIENDVNAAAVGEYSARPGEKEEDLVYLTIDNGVGAGIILNGKLYKGARHSAGEVGYMVFDREFQTSKTQAGWLEQQIYRMLSREQPAGGEEIPKEAIDQAASFIALCIANITSVLDIRNVVIGGEMMERLGGTFLTKLQEKASKLSIHETVVVTRICANPSMKGMSSIVRNNLLDTILAD